MRHKPDEELARLCAQGDAAALDVLISRHYLLIYRAAYRWCGHKHDAEDIAHEACIKVARHIGAFKGDSAFKTWLYRLVVNTAKDFQRKDRQINRTEAEYLREAVETVSGGQEEKQQARHVLSLLDQLPEGMKETAWLVYAEGLNHREAAEVLGCAETTVSWRLFQLKKKLKPLLKDSA